MNVVAVRLLDVTLAIGSRDEIVICFKQTIDSIIRPPVLAFGPHSGWCVALLQPNTRRKMVNQQPEVFYGCNWGRNMKFKVIKSTIEWFYFIILHMAEIEGGLVFWTFVFKNIFVLDIVDQHPKWYIPTSLAECKFQRKWCGSLWHHERPAIRPGAPIVGFSLRWIFLLCATGPIG